MTSRQRTYAIKVCENLGIALSAAAFVLLVFGLKTSDLRHGLYSLATSYFVCAICLRDGWLKPRR